MLKEGISHSMEVTVKPEHSACVVGSGDIDVLGSPAMIAMMEQAAVQLLRPEMEEGFTSVGTIINIEHVRGTKIGGQVKVTATLKSVDGRRLVLDLLAEDAAGVIGKGYHERFIINKERFVAKLG